MTLKQNQLTLTHPLSKDGEHYTQDDPKMRKPLIDLAYNNLNHWKPKIQLDEGLLSTIEYFKNEIA